jgi:hypothetical protein
MARFSMKHILFAYKLQYAGGGIKEQSHLKDYKNYICATNHILLFLISNRGKMI